MTDNEDPVKPIIDSIIDWKPTERGADLFFKASPTRFGFTVTELRVIQDQVQEAIQLSKGRHKITAKAADVFQHDVILIGSLEFAVTSTLIEGGEPANVPPNKKPQTRPLTWVIQAQKRSTGETIELCFFDETATVEVWRPIE